MRFCFSKVKVIALAMIVSFFTLPVFAEENIISSVIISKVKNKVNTYEVNIDSTDEVSYKTNIESDNSIYFDLKNSILADDAATYYDDVTDIDSVAVKQFGNRVRIYVQGKNAKNTILTFTDSEIGSAPSKKKVIINRPINEYAPTNSTDLYDQEDMQTWDDNSFNIGHLMSDLRSGLSGIVLIFFAILLLISTLIKQIVNKYSQEKEPLIGLNNQTEDDSVTSNKEIFAAYQTAQAPKQKSNLKREKAMMNAQMELARAHQNYQTYLKNKYKGNVPNKSNIQVDSITKGIALSQYLKNEQNPYKNQPVIKMDANGALKNSFQIPPRNSQLKENYSSYIKKPQNYVDISKTNSNNGSMKFLESVTKIYEQSGRSDLASGLKTSLLNRK